MADNNVIATVIVERWNLDGQAKTVTSETFSCLHEAYKRQAQLDFQYRTSPGYFTDIIIEALED